eukprot:322814_1
MAVSERACDRSQSARSISPTVGQSWSPDLGKFQEKVVYVDSDAVREKLAAKDIWLAALDGDNEAIQGHLDRGIDINSYGQPGPGWGPFKPLPGFSGTPLHFAAGYGRARTVGFLLERGARPDLKTRSGFTP